MASAFSHFVCVCVKKNLLNGFVLTLPRPGMTGLHLVKLGRDRQRMDQHRDFTVASPAEFVTRFGGNKVIEKAWPGREKER